MTLQRHVQHTRDWFFLCLYLLCIFLILPYSEYITRAFFDEWNRFSAVISFSCLAYICLIGFASALYALIADKKFKIFRLFALTVIISIGLYGLAQIGNPKDKLHIIEYSLLVFLLFRVLRFYNFTFALYLWCVIFIGTAGLTDELIQSRIPGRHSDIRDWMTDMITCILALMLIAFVICPILEKWRLRLESIKSIHYKKQRWAYEYKRRRGKLLEKGKRGRGA